MRIYTLGYLGMLMPAIRDKVAQEGGLLVDCRYSAFSRAVGWMKHSFVEAMGENYLHLKGFGNLNYRPQNAHRGVELADPMEAWILLRQKLVSSMEESADGEGRGPYSSIVLMCACAESAGCHRRDVGEWLRTEFAVMGIQTGEVVNWRKDPDFTELMLRYRAEQREAQRVRAGEVQRSHRATTRARSLGQQRRQARERLDPSQDQMLVAQQRERDRSLGLPPIGVRRLVDAEDGSLDLFEAEGEYNDD